MSQYEHNQVFAGRNWNNGETVELVLRRQDGSFLPTYWLLSTLCHELAHIKHMNHGPAFQALWRQLRAEVRALQDKSYYGDGYWSSGRRLADSARVSGEGIEAGDLPEYMCGGAHTRARPTSVRRFRNERRATEHSTKKRKAGSRVTAKNAFIGEGSKLVEGPVDSLGTGFRKQARSKRAREKRALAAETRIKALQEQSSAPTPRLQTPKTEEDSDDSIEIIETDAERRQALLNSGEQEHDLLRLDKTNAWREFQREFDFGYKPSRHNNIGCDLPVASGSTFTTSSRTSLEKKPNQPLGVSSTSTTSKHSERPPSSGKGKATPDVGLGKIVQTEIQFDSDDEIIVSEPRHIAGPVRPRNNEQNRSAVPQAQWACIVCTLLNEPAHLACAACGTTCGANSS
ncbi:hypothetical protein AX15_001989 [Amanita polypyramis BW_CC]|nr:hypothetical protein AX15_001989 [Amanita polypyramis BW_CC]